MRLGNGIGLDVKRGSPSAPPFGTGILDTYPAQAAYSTRKLRANQTDCMLVTRSSDSDTLVVGFSYNATYGGYFVDTSAITAFVGAGDGVITTWYDQTGNGNHATGVDNPAIVQGGVLKIDTLTGKPTAYLDGSGYFTLPNTSFTSSKSYLLGYAVAQHLSTTRLIGSVFQFSRAASAVSRFSLRPAVATANRFSNETGVTDATLYVQVSDTNHDQVLKSLCIIVDTPSAARVIFENNVVATATVYPAPTAASFPASASQGAYIGYQNGNKFIGNISEVILYNTSTYASGRSAIITDEMTAYGIT